MKQRITLTVDKHIFNRFKEYCNHNSMKVSTKINDLMKKELGDYLRL